MGDSDFKADLIHVGPPKTATTWVYHCLRESPRIRTSQKDSIHYFDMNFHRGPDWYADQFPVNADGDIVFDPTPAYVASDRAPERILAHNPDVKIIICLRNPVDRAFSHYWHLKKKGIYTWRFEDVFSNYDNYRCWLEFGFVSRSLSFFLEHLPRQSVHWMLFEDLKSNPGGEFAKIRDFAGLDDTFVPEGLHRKVNVAGARQTIWNRAVYKGAKLIWGDRVDDASRNSQLLRVASGKSEYLEGVPGKLRHELVQACLPEIEALENLLETDLSAWREPVI